MRIPEKIYSLWAYGLGEHIKPLCLPKLKSINVLLYDFLTINAKLHLSLSKLIFLLQK